jgi:ABC-type sugar transport system substrate-binding protein
VVALTVTAACSSGGDTQASSAPQPAGVAAAAEDFHGSTSLKPGKIGVLLGTATTELTADANLVRQALAKVGWTATVSDGQNSPPTQQTALQDFVQSQVQGIITIAVTSSVVAPQLAAARAAGIPVVSLSDDSNPSAFAATYGGNAAQQGALTTSYVKSKIPAASQYVALDISAVYSIHEFITSTTPLLDAAGFKEVGSYDINPADLTNSIKTGALNLLQAHPHARLLYGCSSLCIPIVAPALAQAGYHDVLIVANSFSQDQPTFSVIRNGSPVAANIQNSDIDALIAVDQILDHSATGTAIDRNANKGVYHSAVVDKSNVPSSGIFSGTTSTQQAQFDDSKLLAGYVAKWQQKYSL